MDIQSIIIGLSEHVLGWPLMIYVAGVSVICTIALKGVQVRYFIYALKEILMPSQSNTKNAKDSDMNSFQAFLNTLSSNLGNGSIAGVATALYGGGPGAAFWLVIFGFILMAVRFVEVYASIIFSSTRSTVLGGPVQYLTLVPGGPTLALVYVVFCFFFGLTGGNASQANSICLSMTTTLPIPPIIIASLLFAFVLYVIGGGADRIVKVSEAIVPIKVGLFCIAMVTLLIYHWTAIPGALLLIFKSAFTRTALTGGIAGFSVMHAIRYGMARSIFATESGLGTAAVLFGATHNADPLASALMGMMSTFVSTLFCFIVMLCIVVSGVWQSGFTSTALTIAAIETVFGNLAGWIVSFLSLSFGLGVIVAYAYIVRVSWLFLTGGRYALVGALLYGVSTFLGALVPVDVVWALVDLVMAGMLIINLYGLMYLLPRIIRHMQTGSV